jgi:hypothetical protein
VWSYIHENEELFRSDLYQPNLSIPLQPQPNDVKLWTGTPSATVARNRRGGGTHTVLGRGDRRVLYALGLLLFNGAGRESHTPRDL